MKKWEYRREVLDLEPLNIVWLNEQGKLGWEVCGFHIFNSGAMSIIFNRELTDDQGTRKTDA